MCDTTPRYYANLDLSIFGPKKYTLILVERDQETGKLVSQEIGVTTMNLEEAFLEAGYGRGYFKYLAALMIYKDKPRRNYRGYNERVVDFKD